MRTTITLDDDVAKFLQLEMRRTGASFKDTVNQFLRLGLVAAKKPEQKPFKVIPVDIDLSSLKGDCVEGWIEQLEGPGHK